jgi:peptidoglycan/LPS O-acetylase OafA/YrhL
MHVGATHASAAVPGNGASRLSQIDGLRGLAALMVLAFHYTTRFDELFIFSQPLPLEVAWGYLGVNLFFAISGFVILMTFDRIGSAREFIAARFSRLFPTYWVAVVLTWVLVNLISLPGYSITWPQAIANLTMVHAFFGVPDVDGVYWSLQVELLYYLWMLALWLVGAMRRPELMLIGWTGISLLSSTATSVLGLHLPWAIQNLLLLEWIPWFGLGMSAYLGSKSARWNVSQVTIATISLGAVALRGRTPEALWAVATLALVISASRGSMPMLSWRLMLFFGGISYPLYLVHEKLGWAVIHTIERLHSSPWTAIAIASTCSIGIATLLHGLVEEPARIAIRQRWQQRTKFQNGLLPSSAAAAAITFAAILVLASGAYVSAHRKAALDERRYQVLLNPPHGTEVPCRYDGELPLRRVVVVLGQSNAASHAERSAAKDVALVFARGKCWETTDPLPHTTGSGSSIWTAAERLSRDQGQAVETVFAPLAVGNTRIGDWLRPGDLSDAFVALLRELDAHSAPVRGILWQQGEADALNATAAADYRSQLIQLRALLDRHGLTAPLYVARSTRCGNEPSTAIHRALDAAATLEPRIRPGADTDILGSEYRVDGCHFNERGRSAAAALWLEVLKRDDASPPMDTHSVSARSRN